jgi:hypothetical protein
MTQYVPIHVPEAHYREMVRHLGSLMTDEARMEPTIRETPDGDDHLWSDEVWENVWPTLTDESRTILALFAEHQGEWVPIEALEESLGSFRRVQSTLSSLTKRMKKHGQTKWPFEVVDGTLGTRAKYKMAEANATIVLRLTQTS